MQTHKVVGGTSVDTLFSKLVKEFLREKKTIPILLIPYIFIKPVFFFQTENLGKHAKQGI